MNKPPIQRTDAKGHGEFHPVRTHHPLKITLAAGSFPVSLNTLFQILGMETFGRISREVANGFQHVATNHLPYLVDLPQDVSLDYQGRTMDHHNCRLCLLFERKSSPINPELIEVETAIAFNPGVLSQQELAVMMDNYLVAKQLAVHKN